MMSVCQKKIRLHPQKRDNLLSALLNFRMAGIDLRDVNMQGVLNTAERFGLSAYDAGYLWLAESLGVELVTLDVRLKKAAAKLR